MKKTVTVTPKKKSPVRKTTRKPRTTSEPTPSVVNEPIAPEQELQVMPAVLSTSPEVTVSDTKSDLALENPIYQHPNQLVLIALLIGLAFDYLFWKQPVGLNFDIFIVLCAVGGLVLLGLQGQKPSKRSLWLLIPFLFFAAITFLRTEPVTIFLAYTFTLIAAGMFATSYLGGRWYLYGLSDYVYRFFLLLWDMFTVPLVFLFKARKVQINSSQGVKGLSIGALARGLAIALPIVICFASLLAAGDLVFKEKLAKNFGTDKISEDITRGVLVLFCAYFVSGIFLHASLRSQNKVLVGEAKPIIKPFLGFTESAVILGSVSSLFLAFVIVQFQYFFGGETNIGIKGFTYSQYARRGFNELITVAFLSLVLILGLSTLTKRNSENQKRWYSGLSVGLVLLVLVILTSAYQRISLAIDWHGFSRLRLYPRVFLIWLGLLFVTVVILEIVRREHYFGLAAVLASIGFAVSLTVVNVDAATVSHNVFRAWHGKNLNVPHLASLSNDAIPALADEFLSSKLPAETHEGVGAILACYRYKEKRPRIVESDWRSFNLSEWQAHQALAEIRPYLEGYIIRYDKWPDRVRTPSGVIYYCDDTKPEQE